MPAGSTRDVTPLIRYGWWLRRADRRRGARDGRAGIPRPREDRLPSTHAIRGLAATAGELFEAERLRYLVVARPLLARLEGVHLEHPDPELLAEARARADAAAAVPPPDPPPEPPGVPEASDVLETLRWEAARRAREQRHRAERAAAEARVKAARDDWQRLVDRATDLRRLEGELTGNLDALVQDLHARVSGVREHIRLRRATYWASLCHRHNHGGTFNDLPDDDWPALPDWLPPTGGHLLADENGSSADVDGLAVVADKEPAARVAGPTESADAA